MDLKEGKRGKLKIFPENFRGQVTIFIIIAILIVAFGVLVYLYYPKIFPDSGGGSKNPAAFIQDCLEEDIEDNLKRISSQGGNYVMNKNSGYFYKKNYEDEGRYVRYLCYTDDNYDVPCVNQEPFLKEHVEQEVLDSINESIKTCFDNMVKDYESRGYNPDLKRGKAYVQIIQGEVYTDFNSTLTLTKGDESETYRNFDIKIKSSLYEIIEVSKNILIWEMNIGDSIPEAYMYNNPYIRVEKHRKDNDIKIYVVSEVNSGEDFRFAVRSFASPVGFGNVNI